MISSRCAMWNCNTSFVVSVPSNIGSNPGRWLDCSLLYMVWSPTSRWSWSLFQTTNRRWPSAPFAMAGASCGWKSWAKYPLHWSRARMLIDLMKRQTCASWKSSLDVWSNTFQYGKTSFQGPEWILPPTFRSSSLTSSWNLSYVGLANVGSTLRLACVFNISNRIPGPDHFPEKASLFRGTDGYKQVQHISRWHALIQPPLLVSQLRKLHHRSFPGSIIYQYMIQRERVFQKSVRSKIHRKFPRTFSHMNYPQ